MRRRGSVDRGAGLVIERLGNVSSTPNAVARHCVFGNLMLLPTLRTNILPFVVLLRLTKDMQTEQLLCWSGMPAQSIEQHLVQTKKNNNNKTEITISAAKQ